MLSALNPVDPFIIVMFENNKLCLINVLLEVFCNMFRRVPEVGNIIVIFQQPKAKVLFY